MKKYITTFVYMFLFFGIFMGIYFTLMAGPQRGILSGLLSGLLFGGFMSFFSYVMNKRIREANQGLAKGKPVIMEDSCNRLTDSSRVGGYMVLTKDELIFATHAAPKPEDQPQRNPYKKGGGVAPKKDITHITLKNIVEMKDSKQFKIMSNGLTLNMKNGETYTFVLFDRKKWRSEIERLQK